MFHLINRMRKAKAGRAQAAAELERQDRLAAFRAAVRRGDTRSQHETYPAAVEATNAALRLEIKR